METAQIAVGEDAFPAYAPLHERLRYLLRYAVLAPSTHNTQPWRFRVRETSVDVYADPRRNLAVIDKHRRQQIMSVAAAVKNLEVALRRFGHVPEIVPFPAPGEPELVASVELGKTARPSALDLELFEAITRRRTNRQPFFNRPVSYRIVDELRRQCEAEGAVLTRLHPRAKAPLAEVITVADRSQFGDSAFRKELSRWLVPSGSRRKDGIPFAKKEYGSALPVGPMMVRTFDIGGKVAAKERDLATGSPVLLVLSTVGDSAGDWLVAGLAMQAMLLRATTFGLSASFLNQPLEIDAVRPRVAELAAEGGVPQLVLRMGFGPAVDRPTPRRPLAEVIIDD
jgi:nitroreductase